MKEEPLVTVAVIAYNSSEYVLETLASIEMQTYRNIELIISDDGSTDSTVELCRKWLEVKKERFAGTRLLSVESNTGVPANANRAVRAACGEWIKIIAADDLLLPSCVADYMDSEKEAADVLVGMLQAFYVDPASGRQVCKEVWPGRENLFFFDLPASHQHRRLLLHSFNFAPGVFIRKSVFERYGYYNEEYKYFEDLPYWLHITSKGIKFHLLPRVTVMYRTQHSSLVFARGRFFNERFMTSLFSFRKQVVYPEVPFWNWSFYQAEGIEHLRYYLIMKLCRNKKNRVTSGIYRFITALSCRTWYNRLRKYSYKNKDNKWKTNESSKSIR